MNAFRLLAAILGIALGFASACGHAAEKGGRTKEIEAMLRAESLGGLRLGLPEREVLKQLGKPGKQTALTVQETDGMYVQGWLYPAQGITLQMSAGKKTGPKSVSMITATAPCGLSTTQGIKIGSIEFDVRKAYAAFIDRDTPAERGTFVAGSIYGGIIFNFSKGKVSRIFFGAAAE